MLGVDPPLDQERTTEAARLQDLGVEVVTIYHAPPRDSGLYDDANGMSCRLLEYTAEQYRRLASWENYACRGRHYDPGALAAQIQSQSQPVARASSWGVLKGVD